MKGQRSQDMWQFYLPPVEIECIVSVVDSETKTPISNVEVILKGSDGSVHQLKSNEKGLVHWIEKEDQSRFITPGKTYTIIANGIDQQWLSGRDMFSTKNLEFSTRFVREINLVNSRSESLSLPEIRYDFNAHALQVNDSINSRDSLDYLYRLMIENPNIVVRLMSNSDSRGLDKDNDKLSQLRAETCMNYLVNERGIPKERLSAKGLGESNPNRIQARNSQGELETIVLTEDYINQFKDNLPKFEQLHQLNRRTEFKIISHDYK